MPEFLFIAMAKRFTDTEKWKDEWYLSLSNDYKIVWQWLLDNCNHAGICKRSLRLLNMMCSVNITEEELKNTLEGRLVVRDTIWFIPNFLKFQYSTLKSNKPAIVGVVKELIKNKCDILIPDSFGDEYYIKKSFHNDFDMITELLDNHSDMIKDKDKDKVLNYNGDKINKKDEILNFEFFVLNFENVSHAKSDVPGIENFTEEEYIHFQAFLGLFKDYESRIERNPFPSIKFYRDKLEKFGFEDLQAGVDKMFALGVKSNMDLGLRLIDCIGWVMESKNKPKKRSEITTNDKLESQAKSMLYAKHLMEQDEIKKNEF